MSRYFRAAASSPVTRFTRARRTRKRAPVRFGEACSEVMALCSATVMSPSWNQASPARVFENTARSEDTGNSSVD